MFSLNAYLDRLSIGRKIAVGYSVSVGIAVLGTGAGLAIGGLSEQQAVYQYRSAQNQTFLLERLENESLQLILHPEKLLATMEESLWLRYEISTYGSDEVRLKDTIEELSQIAALQDPEDSSELSALLEAMLVFLDDYRIWNQRIWSVFDNQPELFQDEMMQQVTSPTWRDLQIRFERLSEDLTLLSYDAQFRRDGALFAWEQARRFRVWISALSMVMASALAILLALFTSRAIARPIYDLTKITQHITEQADFEQRVTIASQDETAQLAMSIDRLVMWVKQYTDELQLARDTLEIRIQERTEELQQTQSRLVQNEKMSSLGQLVAGVAHEINNPVSFIYGNIQPTMDHVSDLFSVIELYREYYPEPDEEIADFLEEVEIDFIEQDLPKILQSMRTGANRIKEIVLSLRTFSRLDESHLKKADLHAGIESTLMILKHRLKAQPSRPAINVTRNYGDLPLIECYAGPLNQVFMNLLVNAIDALEVELKEGNIEQLEISISTRILAEFCSIQIHNNGSAIPADVKARMFDPFFTTKEIGQGTGMGLAISYQIVTERHGGTLTCISNDNGTQFIILLPVLASSLQAA